MRHNRCGAMLRLIDEALAGYERDAPALAASANLADIRPKNHD